jgi:hypothetical protein
MVTSLTQKFGQTPIRKDGDIDLDDVTRGAYSYIRHDNDEMNKAYGEVNSGNNLENEAQLKASEGEADIRQGGRAAAEGRALEQESKAELELGESEVSSGNASILSAEQNVANVYADLDTYFAEIYSNPYAIELLTPDDAFGPSVTGIGIGDGGGESPLPDP